MAITQPALLALGLFATLATIGMFLDYGDKATRPLVGFTAAIVWATVSLSAFNVWIPADSVAYEKELTPVVYIAAALAFITFMFTLRMLLMVAKDEAEATDFNPMD